MQIGIAAAAADLLRALIASSARRARHEHGRMPRNEDYAALKRAVRERGLLDRQHGYYAAMTAAVLGLVAFAILWVARTKGTALVWIGAPIAAFTGGQLVLLGHDAAHHAIFASRRANDALAMLAINVLSGGSYGWWAQSHNEHHARSNELWRDPDIDYPFLAFSEEQARDKDPRFAPILARQHWLAPMLMTMVGITMRVYSLAWLAKRRGRVAEIACALPFYAVYPALVISALGPLRGVVFIALHQALFGLYLGLVTSANHWGMPMPEGAHGLDFVRHQVTTSRNICGGILVDIVYGGLNRQIEHHLFPTMPRNKLPEARRIVRAFCAERGIVHREAHPIEAYREIWTAMRRVALSVQRETESHRESAGSIQA